MTLRASSSPMERHCQIFVDWEWRWNLWASRAVERVGRKVRNGCTTCDPSARSHRPCRGTNRRVHLQTFATNATAKAEGAHDWSALLVFWSSGVPTCADVPTYEKGSTAVGTQGIALQSARSSASMTADCSLPEQ